MIQNDHHNSIHHHTYVQYSVRLRRTLKIYSLGDYSHHAALYPHELFILQLEVHIFGVFCLVGWLVEFLFIQIQHISEQATFLSMHLLEVVRSKVVPPL